MSKLSARAVFAGTISLSDKFHLVDVSDLTQGAGGSSFAGLISQLKTAIDTNIYNSDGALIANRTVDLDTFVLNFDDGQTTFKGQNNLSTHFALKAIDSSSNEIITARNDGRVSIGSGITPSAKLHIKGEGATSATFSLRVENSASTTSFSISDQTHVGIGTPAVSTVQLRIADGLGAGFDMLQIINYLSQSVMYIDYRGYVGLQTTTPRNILDIRTEGDANTSEIAYGFEAVGAIWQNRNSTNNNWTSLQFRTQTGTVAAYIDIQNTNHSATEGNMVLHANFSGAGSGNIYFGNITSGTLRSFFNTNSNSWMIGATSTAIDGSALMQFESTTKGVLLPRMTTAQKNAISTPAAGLIVYDTTLNKACLYTTAWETITSI